jgi:amino acid efflux transporter
MVPAGLRLASSILGAGLLLAPPVVAGLAGPAAPAAWLIHLGLGAAFSMALGLHAQARGRPTSIAELTGAALGGWGERAVLASYFGGFTVGQAAIALAAGHFAAVGFGWSQPAAAAAAGCVLLAVATLGAAAGIQLDDRARRCRLAATAALAGYGCARPEWFAAVHLLPDGVRRWFTGAVFVAFFAGVGWESSARIGPSVAGRRRLIGAVLLGAALVGCAYLGLALLLQVRSAGAVGLPDGLLDRALALAAAATLALYCMTNLTAAAGLARALRARSTAGTAGPGRVGRTVPPVGAASIGLVVLAAIIGWSPGQLLIGPCLATCTGYLLAGVATARAGAGVSRVAAGLVAAALIVVLSALTAQEL